MFWKKEENLVENSEISPEVFNQFIQKNQVKIENRRTPIDNIISVIAFIFDINFKISFEIIKREDYINKILNRYKIKNIDTKEKIEKIREIANSYIEQKIKE